MQHLYPVFIGCLLSEIDTVAIRAYIHQRQVDGAAASTINKDIGCAHLLSITPVKNGVGSW